MSCRLTSPDTVSNYVAASSHRGGPLRSRARSRAVLPNRSLQDQGAASGGAWLATPAPPPQHSTSGPCQGGVTVNPAPLPPRTRLDPTIPVISATGDLHDERSRAPTPLGDRGRVAYGGLLLTARRRAARPAVRRASRERLAGPPAMQGMNPCREADHHLGRVASTRVVCGIWATLAAVADSVDWLVDCGRK